MTIAAAHHTLEPGPELSQLMGAISVATLLGGIVWVIYLAIEPYARRFWPHALLGWTRLLAGRIRDPRVGRDVLIGIAFGAFGIAAELLHAFVPACLGAKPQAPPFGNAVGTIAGAGTGLSRLGDTFYTALQSALLIALFFIVVRLIIRRVWPATIVGTVLLIAILNSGQAFTGTVADFVFLLAIALMISFTLNRFGLLTLFVSGFVSNVVTSMPLTPQVSAWWATPSNLAIVMLLALTAFAFYAARAGQSLFGRIEA